jgi:hypothetical protein
LGSQRRGVDPIEMEEHQKNVNKGKTPEISEEEAGTLWLKCGEIDYIDANFFRNYLPELPEKIIKKGEKLY